MLWKRPLVPDSCGVFHLLSFFNSISDIYTKDSVDRLLLDFSMGAFSVSDIVPFVTLF